MRHCGFMIKRPQLALFYYTQIQYTYVPVDVIALNDILAVERRKICSRLQWGRRYRVGSVA